MSWVNELKLAVASEDTDKIGRLSDKFSKQNFSKDEAVEVAALIASAIEILKKNSDHIQSEMVKLHNVKRFIQA